MRDSDARRFDMEAALERASRDKRSLEVELERLGREGPQGIVQVAVLILNRAIASL